MQWDFFGQQRQPGISRLRVAPVPLPGRRLGKFFVFISTNFSLVNPVCIIAFSPLMIIPFIRGKTPEKPGAGV